MLRCKQLAKKSVLFTLESQLILLFHSHISIEDERTLTITDPFYGDNDASQSSGQAEALGVGHELLLQDRMSEYSKESLANQLKEIKLKFAKS